MNKGQLVSIIITTKNEEAVIARLIASIKKQTYLHKEVILVDNSSTDKTLDIAQKMGVKVYSLGPERSAQRNFGAKHSKGSFLLFLDADMELSKDVINECVELSKDSNIGGVAIPEKSKAVSFWEKVKAFERSFYNEKGDPIIDAARFFTKWVFQKAGGYDETITGPEDWDLPETIREKGYEIARIRACIYHRERVSSPINLAKKKFYYAQRAYRYLTKHNIPILGPKTIYFLRPVFYKNTKKIITHPILSIGMVIMLSAELLGGGLGYLLGRIRKL